ncbi:sialidase family protein [Helicobacter baculiformis]|uniref:Sialidase family protein n=1 Tax=Helicobacter baculiformis TaxID=427351 RepID=A0ABV7ZGZ5_9HELI|nr:sialidase family protein [Helicobacter baculiformis]
MPKSTWGFGILLGILFITLISHAPQKFSFTSPPVLQESTHALLDKRALPTPKVASMHAATLSILSDRFLLAAYFAGSAEGERDVQIYANLYDLNTQTWSPPFVLLSAKLLSQLAGVYVKALGNPVLVKRGDCLYLFVVGVSLGGWATSRIYTLSIQTASLHTSVRPHLTFLSTLSLGPFLNISHLVRNTALLTDDGGFVLPIYHELATKMPLLLKFDAHAHLQEVIKPNTLSAQLQPTLTPYQTCALMLFRSYRHTNLYAQTCQDPTHWNPPTLSNLRNYNDALALFNANGTLYLIYNAPLPNSPRSRSALRLARFAPTPKQPSYFNPLVILDQSHTSEVSYPCVLVSGDKVHVLYTKERHAIMHLVFNSAYLKAL